MKQSDARKKRTFSIRRAPEYVGQWLHAVGAGLRSLWPWTGRQTRAVVWPILAAVVFVAAVWRLSTVMLLLATAVWVWNICYSLRRLRERFLFFMFHVTFFVFLLDRPLINLIDGGWVEYQMSYGATADGVYRATAMLLLSLLGLRAGAEILDRRLLGRVPTLRRAVGLLARPERQEPSTEKGISRTKLIRLLSLGLFLFSLLFSLILSIEKAVFMLRYSYAEYYASFSSVMPYIFYVFSTFLPYSLCVFLATRPDKREAYAALGAYILTTVPSLLGGSRSEIVLAVLLALCYFVYRDYLGTERQWIGKGEKVLIACGAVVGIVLLAWINYSREGSDVGETGVLFLVRDFFLKQGVTFSWLSCGMSIVGTLRATGVRSYTLGTLADYILHGSVAQKLFGASALSSSNSLAQVTEGHVLSHYLSYYVLGKEKYLAGHGTGSSYLLELYVDMGALGVLVFSVLLGLALAGAFRFACKGQLRTVLVLSAISGILWMPRGDALSGAEFLWRIPFWLTLLGVFVGSRVLLWLGRRWPWLGQLLERLYEGLLLWWHKRRIAGKQ